MTACVCEMCGLQWESSCSDEEARAGALETFGPMPEEETAMVCTACYDKLRPMWENVTP